MFLAKRCFQKWPVCTIHSFSGFPVESNGPVKLVMYNEVAKAQMSISLPAPFLNSWIRLFYLKSRNVTSAQNFTAFNKNKHCFNVCLVLKTYHIETNSVSFHEPNIKKGSVHVCLVLKTCVPLWLYEVGPEIWTIYAFFLWTTVHNSHYKMCSIKLWGRNVHQLCTIIHHDWTM